VVFDDYFSTVPSEEGTIDQASWLKLITFPSARLQCVFDEADDPLLADEWLTPDEAILRQQQHRHDAVVRPATEPAPDQAGHPDRSNHERKNDDQPDSNVPDLDSEEAPAIATEEADTPAQHRSVQVGSADSNDTGLTQS